MIKIGSVERDILESLAFPDFHIFYYDIVWKYVESIFMGEYLCENICAREEMSLSAFICKN